MTPTDPSTTPVTAWPPTPGQRAPVGLFVVTADHRVCALNEAAQDWFRPARNLLPLPQFLGIAEHDERTELLQAFVEQLKAKPQPRELRLTLRRADDQAFAGLLMASPLRDVDGNHLGFEAVLLDLSRWSDREALVPRTQGEALELRLQSTEHALGLLQREMEGFSQIFGHDMRAPLRHAVSYLRLLRERADTSDDTALKEYGAGVQQALQRLNLMVEAMHDYVHLCRARLNLQPVPLGPLVQSVVARLPARGQGAPVEWRVDPGLPVVRGDPMLLAEAFRHLLDNAVKFTRTTAQPVITLACERTLEGSHLFRVEDNGVGFDRQHAEKLFLLFQRQHHSTEYEGLGVGLAMAHRIVERHGGRMFCDATPGGGCRVFFVLPDGTLDSPGPAPAAD
jgi:signal transduction histidine kinase